MKQTRKSKSLGIRRDYLVWLAIYELGIPIEDVPKIFNCSRMTIYNVIKNNRIKSKQ